MNNTSAYSRAICFKGWWNIVITVGFAFGEGWLRHLTNYPKPLDWFYQLMFLGLAFVFGIGYVRASRDLVRGRETLFLGVLGQTSVCVLTLVLCGTEPCLFNFIRLGAGLMDGTFAVIYWRYLTTHAAQV